MQVLTAKRREYEGFKKNSHYTLVVWCDSSSDGEAFAAEEDITSNVSEGKSSLTSVETYSYYRCLLCLLMILVKSRVVIKDIFFSCELLCCY